MDVKKELKEERKRCTHGWSEREKYCPCCAESDFFKRDVVKYKKIIREDIDTFELAFQVYERAKLWTEGNHESHEQYFKKLGKTEGLTHKANFFKKLFYTARQFPDLLEVPEEKRRCISCYREIANSKIGDVKKQELREEAEEGKKKFTVEVIQERLKEIRKEQRFLPKSQKETIEFEFSTRKDAMDRVRHTLSTMKLKKGKKVRITIAISDYKKTKKRR